MPVALGLALKASSALVRPAQDVVPLHGHPVGDVADRRHHPDVGLRPGVGQPERFAVARRRVRLRQGRHAARKPQATSEHQRFHRPRAYCRFAAMKIVDPSRLDRRAFLAAATGVAASPVPRPRRPPAAPVSPVATPRDWTNQTPMAYPDPDLVALDPRFRRYIVFNNVIKRLHIGTGWAEGPAWNGVGKYLVWSDIPANAQMRWIEDDARVTTFRNNSGLQQRQHVRLRGPPDQLRARRPPRGPLRAERHGDGDRREVPGQAAEFAERRRGASRRRRLVHRSVLRHRRQLRGVQGGIGDEGSGVSRGPEDRRRWRR